MNLIIIMLNFTQSYLIDEESIALVGLYKGINESDKFSKNERNMKHDYRINTN